MLHGGFVAVAGTKLHTLGLFLMMCAIEAVFTILICQVGTICQCVLFKTFVMLVLLSFQTIVHTTLCLSILSHRLTLIPPPSSINARRYSYFVMFVLCGTKCRSVFWELRAVLFFATLFTNIFVVIFKCNFYCC